MWARQLIGRDAGTCVQMPFDVFQRNKDNGTVCEIGQEPVIRGMVWGPIPDGVEAAAPAEVAPAEVAPADPDTDTDTDSDDAGAVEVPEDWQTLHHMSRRALAKEITGDTYDDAASADAAIQAYLDAE